MKMFAEFEGGTLNHQGACFQLPPLNLRMTEIVLPDFRLSRGQETAVPQEVPHLVNEDRRSGGPASSGCPESVQDSP